MLKALKENGVLENTMVIFTSDNGSLKRVYSQPYSGTKYITMGGGHRVPFIIYRKGTLQPAELDLPVIAMDLFPTLSELISAPMPTDRVFDGVSLMPLFEGKPIACSSDEPFYYYNCENLQCVRVGDWKLHLPRTTEQLPFWSMKKQEEISKPRLYNLAWDAGELNDIAALHPERVSKMIALAQTIRHKLREYGQRGSQQRPTGTLFPEVPIVSNNSTDWDTLSDQEKGREKTKFVPREK